ncbi:MAG: hypothetical protein ACYTG7_06285 [Planctomycetota bacterium]
MTAPRLTYLLLFTLVLSISSATLAQDIPNSPQGEKITYKVTGDTYFGDKNHFKNPCVLDRDKVFKKIPAYQKILREKLDKNSARYYFLLEQANKVFRDKVKEIAKKLGFDLVVEKGGIKANKEIRITEITKKVIKVL